VGQIGVIYLPIQTRIGTQKIKSIARHEVGKVQRLTVASVDTETMTLVSLVKGLGRGRECYGLGA
jgi:uncharacterized protein YjaZ